MENYHKLRREENGLQRTKELKSTLRAGSGEFEACKEKIAAYKNSSDVMKGILIRQLTTKIYKEATTHYITKLNERENVRNELSRLTGERFHVTLDEEMALNLNFTKMLYDFQNQAV